MGTVTEMFSRLDIREQGEIAARRVRMPEVQERLASGLGAVRAELQQWHSTNKEIIVAPENETDTERKLREYRQAWKPFDLRNIGLSEADIALFDANSDDPDECIFLLGGEVKFRRWTVNGYGDWEVGQLALLRPSADDGHFFAGLNERGDAIPIPVAVPVTGAGDDVGVAYEYPLGHLDEVQVLSLRVGTEQRKNWVDSNRDLASKFFNGAPLNKGATDNHVRICEYMKDNNLEPSPFTWRRAMHHDQQVYRGLCDAWWAKVDEFLADHTAMIQRCYAHLGHPRQNAEAYGRKDVMAVSLAKRSVNFMLNCQLENGEKLW